MRIPCIECGESSLDTARGRCPNCYMRDFRRRHRMKVLDCRNCGVSFAAARRDALYCSQACRQRAHRKASQRAQARGPAEAVRLAGHRRGTIDFCRALLMLGADGCAPFSEGCALVALFSSTEPEQTAAALLAWAVRG